MFVVVSLFSKFKIQFHIYWPLATMMLEQSMKYHQIPRCHVVTTAYTDTLTEHDSETLTDTVLLQYKDPLFRERPRTGSSI